MNFQMFKLDSEKAEEPEINLPTYYGSSKKQESSRKTSTSALLTTLKPFTEKTVKKVLGYGNTRPPYLLPEKSVCRSRSNKVNQTWKNGLFQIAKGVCQGCILSPCLFTLYTEYIRQNAGLDEAQAGINIVGRKINNLRYADDTTLTAKAKRN